jgi:hypothetical protein
MTVPCPVVWWSTHGRTEAERATTCLALAATVLILGEQRGGEQGQLIVSCMAP